MRRSFGKSRMSSRWEMKSFTPDATLGILKTPEYRSKRASAPAITGVGARRQRRGCIADEAGRTAVVYDARADEFDEPLRVFVTGYSATELRDRRRPRGNLRYSLVGGLPRAARWQIGAPGVLLAVGVDRSTQGQSRLSEARVLFEALASFPVRRSRVPTTESVSRTNPAWRVLVAPICITMHDSLQ
jgi:hypothetical protein